MTAKEIIDYFGMEPLNIEGGYVKEMYFSDTIIKKDALPERYKHDKPIYGTILFLITADCFSRMHWLPTDEIYHFYLGDPVEQLQLLEDGSGRIIRLGQDIFAGEQVQAIAPANCWHGSRLAPGGEFALLGTTMAPAWDEEDFVDGLREELIKQYPKFERQIIERT